MRILTDLRRRMGSPHATTRWLASYRAHSAHPGPWFAKSIALASVVRWDRWHDFNQSHRLDCGNLPPPDLEMIATSRSLARVTIDLRDIVGFGSSKGPIEQLSDLRGLAMRLSPNTLAPSRENLERLLAHDQIRISVDGEGRDGDNLYRFGWERGYWIGNHGGSHHLAAAIVVARAIDANVRVAAPLYDYAIETAGTRLFADRWQSFLLPLEYLPEMSDALDTDRIAFAVTFAPEPFHGHFALHLERRDPQSRLVGNLFVRHFCDLSEAMRIVLARQDDLVQQRKRVLQAALSLTGLLRCLSLAAERWVGSGSHSG